MSLVGALRRGRGTGSVISCSAAASARLYALNERVDFGASERYDTR